MLFSMNGLNTFLIAKLGWVEEVSPDEERAQPPPPSPPPEPKQENLLDYWGKNLAALCSAAAIQIALVSAQTHSQLPAIFCVLGFTIILAFTCFFVSKCIGSRFAQAAQVLQRSSIFFGVTAIFIAITIPFPLWFKSVTCFIYALAWLTNHHLGLQLLQLLLTSVPPPYQKATNVRNSPCY